MNNPYSAKLENAIEYALSKELEQDIAIFLTVSPDEIKISDSTDQKIRSMIATIPSSFSKTIWQWLCRAAVIVLLTCTTAAAILMCIPSVRASVWTVVETFFERYIGIEWITEDETNYPEIIENIYLPRLDDTWTKETVFESLYMVKHGFSGSGQEYVIFSQHIYHADITQTIDDNYSSVEKIILFDSVPAYLYTYPDGTQILLWLDRYTFTMVAENTPRETLLALAASVSPQ